METVNFKVTGVVEGGKRMGRRLGFPTANIAPDGAYELPADGVYVAKIEVPGEKRPLLCVVSQGMHPTLPEGKPTVEAYILDFDRYIYGETVSIEYLRYLRPEIKYDSLDALIEQMHRDVAEARKTTISN
jgi:riboflavin kinase/FMN adenylyltransferase